jgi:hypothetical protein
MRIFIKNNYQRITTKRKKNTAIFNKKRKKRILKKVELIL